MLVQIPRCVRFRCIGKDCPKCLFVYRYVCKKIHEQYNEERYATKWVNNEILAWQVCIFPDHSWRYSKNSSTRPTVSNIKTLSSVRSFFRREKLNITENNETEALRMERVRISANARERQTTAKWIIQFFISSMSQHRVNLSRHSHVNLIYLICFSIILAQCISQYR